MQKYLANYLLSIVLNESNVIFTTLNYLEKTIFDSIEMRDGELSINSGACHSGPRSKLFFNGGLNSLLPLLELIHGITIYAED